MRPLLAPLLLALALPLAGCGGDATSAGASTSTSSGASQQARTRIGDVVVHASVVQTATLDASIARQYGLERSGRLVMLLVSVRRTDGGTAPAGVLVQATAVPAQGAPQPIALRELRVGELVDRVGTVDIAPPETVRFDVSIRYGASTSTMSFSRDFFPR